MRISCFEGARLHRLRKNALISSWPVRVLIFFVLQRGSGVLFLSLAGHFAARQTHYSDLAPRKTYPLASCSNAKG
jgi:hypothetical protein